MNYKYLHLDAHKQFLLQIIEFERELMGSIYCEMQLKCESINYKFDTKIKFWVQHNINYNNWNNFINEHLVLLDMDEIKRIEVFNDSIKFDFSFETIRFNSNLIFEIPISNDEMDRFKSYINSQYEESL